jgi:hypothetical protein
MRVQAIGRAVTQSLPVAGLLGILAFAPERVATAERWQSG